jgi:hypothetical protein
MGTPVGSVSTAVTVNGTVVTDVILNCEIDMQWGMHDIAQVRIEYNRLFPMSTIIPWADNAPVKISWGRSPNPLNTWYGYVAHNQLASNADSGDHNLQYDYVLLGTSKVMNAMSNKNWGVTTPTAVAKLMAQKYKMRCVVTTPATTVTPGNITQASMTDFQFMNYLAQKSGYRFYVSGGTMYFVDPAVYFTGSQTQGVSVFTQNKSLITQDTMRDFRVNRGDSLPGSTLANRTTYGIDTSSGSAQVVTASSGNSNPIMYNTTRVASSLAEVQQVQSAWDGLSQFWIGGTAELFGDQSLYPGKLIYADGNALPQNNQGYWCLSRTRHQLIQSGSVATTNDKFVTQVEMIRNQQGPKPAITGVVTISPEQVTMSLSGSQWASSSQAVISDGVSNGA